MAAAMLAGSAFADHSASAATSNAPTAFAILQPETSRDGYLARLLINEVPFPGERGYVSVADSKAAMLSVLWVLHARLRYVPNGYKPEELAVPAAGSDIFDLITAPRQCEGFHRAADGSLTMDRRVGERITYLLRIANSGGAPGRFAELLNYAQTLATAYLDAGEQGEDLFKGLTVVGGVAVTGRAYSWMAGQDVYDPGGNFVSIPEANRGILGGNRFFTLRKDPK